jgi:glycosyltransferase involved in cell wall biosynthesis
VTASVVIPAHDEAPVIGEIVRACRDVEGVDEVIVVDDASRDDTAAVATAAGATVLRLEHNVGKGVAVRTGAAVATGDVLVLLDGDGQDPPREIPRLLAAIQSGADLVIGSRFLGAFDPGAITPIDHAGNRALSWAFGRLFGVDLTDTQAGFRAVRRELFVSLPLHARRFDIETELLGRALQAGARVVEVPVTRHARAHGITRLRRFTDGMRILGCMVRVRTTRGAA